MKPLTMQDFEIDRSEQSGGRPDAADLEQIRREYRDSLPILIKHYNQLGSNGKLTVTIGVPVLLILAVAGAATYGFGQIEQAAQSGGFAAAIVGWQTVMVALAAIGSAILGFSGYVLSKDIVQSTRSMAAAMEDIVDGKTEVSVPCRGRVDEFGVMAEAIEVFRVNTRELIAAKEAEALARETLEQMAENQRTMVAHMSEQFSRTVGDVVASVAAASSQLKTTAKSMADAADSASNQSDRVASAMQEASNGATAAAAASDEFAMSIGEISRQAATSAELARKASSSAEQADATISRLSSAADEVSQVVELIQTIARRTNLLALNASIEAARGGEAGRGFAVVASEVKELAAQTSRATEEVAAQIRSMQSSTDASVAALKDIGTQIEQLEATAISIASAVDQQSVAGQDLARSIDLAARSGDRVLSDVEGVRETALATGSAAAQVLASATDLEGQSGILRDQVDRFLAKVREG